MWKFGQEKNRQDLVGQTFGRLTVLSTDYSQKKAISTCLCSCGREHKAGRADLASGITKSCGCLKIDKAKENLEKVKDQTLPIQKLCVNREYEKYRRAAEARDRSFSLSLLDVERLLFGNCFYCDATPSREFKAPFKNQKKPEREIILCNGIDRVDNSIGYIVENCVTCCPKCNLMKHVLSEDEFLEQVMRIAEFTKRKK